LQETVLQTSAHFELVENVAFLRAEDFGFDGVSHALEEFEDIDVGAVPELLAWLLVDHPEF
jgi:hypothetical protein